MKRFGMIHLLSTTRMPLREGEADKGAEGAGTPAPTASGDTGVVAEPLPVGTPAPPEGLPEGFANVADFVKAVEDGTYKPKGLDGDGTKVETQGTENEAPKTGVDLQIAETVKQMGPEFGAKAEPFIRELATTGDMTPESIATAATTLGIPEALVQQYVADRKAEAAQAGTEATSPVYELVGGEENYPGFQEWASSALGPQDHAKINAALGLSADGSKVEGAPDAAALKEYTDAYLASGRAPGPRDLTQTSAVVSAQTADTDVFANVGEQSAAINDPRYRKDQAYRAKVEAKMARSNF